MPLVQGAPAEVEVFPGAHHLPAHGVQVVPLVLGPVVEAVARLEGWTLIAGAGLVTVTLPRLSSKHKSLSLQDSQGREDGEVSILQIIFSRQ